MERLDAATDEGLATIPAVKEKLAKAGGDPLADEARRVRRLRQARRSMSTRQLVKAAKIQPN